MKNVISHKGSFTFTNANRFQHISDRCWAGEINRPILIMVFVFVALLLTGGRKAEGATRVDAVAIAVPSLVHILVLPKALAKGDQPATREESAPELPIGKMTNGSSSGSGVIISSDGYILSVSHLFDDVDKIRIWTIDKRQFDAKIVGLDRHRNIALLKIEATGLTAARIGDAARIRLGESIFSAGVLPESFGLGPVVTEGIISTLSDANTSDYLPMIQTTSQITPSMGGGGLFNENGELLGLSAQVYANKNLGQAMSFSIPINDAMKVQTALKQYGRVKRASIGLRIADVTDQIASALNLVSASGVLVQAVEPGGPADKAGLLAGDVIVQIEKRTVKRISDFRNATGAVEPGATIIVKLWRRGQVKELPVTTVELPVR